MKKLYTTPEYKRLHERKIKLKIHPKKRKKKIRKAKITTKKPRNKKRRNIEQSFFISNETKPIAIAPSKLKLIENTEECLDFFEKMRSKEYQSTINHIKYVEISLAKVDEIDYAAISALTAITNNLKYKRINLRGDFPQNPECRKFFEDSNFLTLMVDENGKKFPQHEASDFIFFTKGSKKLSAEESKKMSIITKKIVNRLLCRDEYCKPLKSILLEISGNSLDWAGEDDEQWLLGVQYDTDSVTITMTDAGKGILKTLHKKFDKKVEEFISQKNNKEILYGAFQKKYGSSTQEVNRNKGLPAVKYCYDNQMILKLNVLTNNVILHFDDLEESRTFKSNNFRGTLYQWEMNQDCLMKALNINLAK